MSTSALSLHDALPIFQPALLAAQPLQALGKRGRRGLLLAQLARHSFDTPGLLLQTLILVTLPAHQALLLDRKSTRLNSSHVKISYAVFCLKKKNKSHS